MGAKVKFTPYWIHTITLSMLFMRFGYDYDFINLDVEGLNLELFESIQLAGMFKLRVICVEHDGHIDRMAALAAPYGFKPISINGENLILSRNV